MSRQNKDLPKPANQEINAVNTIRQVVKHADLTDDGGAYGSVDLGETLPDGAFVLATQARVITAFDGTNPDLTLGTSGDVDRYCSGEIGLGSTGEIEMGTPSGNQAHDGETTVQARIGEDTDFGNITTGVVLVEVHYLSR